MKRAKMAKISSKHFIALNGRVKVLFYQVLAEDHGRKPVGESVPLKQMKEIV